MEIKNFTTAFTSNLIEESQIESEIEILWAREILISKCLEEHAYFY